MEVPDTASSLFIHSDNRLLSVRFQGGEQIFVDID
jgi:hypothetical protein